VGFYLKLLGQARGSGWQASEDSRAGSVAKTDATAFGVLYERYVVESITISITGQATATKPKIDGAYLSACAVTRRRR
jgi:hypothetical protein